MNDPQIIDEHLFENYAKAKTKKSKERNLARGKLVECLHHKHKWTYSQITSLLKLTCSQIQGDLRRVKNEKVDN